MLAAALAARGWAAEKPPAPPQSVRRSFDFSPPRPGEMLANPASGVGTPPHLADFSPVAIKDLRKGADAGTTRQTESLHAAESSDATSAPPAPAGPPAPPPTEDLTPAQMKLADLISRWGIDGFLAPDENTLTPAMPAKDPAFELARRELANSLMEWKTLYPLPPRTADAPVDVDISPGRVTFRRAPARMLGGSGPWP